MRRVPVLILIAIMLMVLLAAAGCGTSSAILAGDESPEAILAAAIAASENLTSATGSFEVEVSFDADLSRVPEEELGLAQAFTDEPIKVSGTFASSNEPQAADLTAALAMAGETMDVGVRLVDGQMWLCLLDQWYEAPPEAKEALEESSTQDAEMAEMTDLMSELGVDPVTWLKDARVVGQETVDGTAVFHLTGSPDVAKMMADMIGLMASEEFMALVDPTGAMGESTGVGAMIPSADELQETQTQIAEVFQGFVVDLWIAKDTAMLHKASVTAHIVPPAEEAAGMNAIDLAMTISLQNLNQPVNIVAPASALPYADLEKALEENPDMLMGPFMGIMGMSGTGYGVNNSTY